jgi:hypothetical protein
MRCGSSGGSTSTARGDRNMAIDIRGELVHGAGDDRAESATGRGDRSGWPPTLRLYTTPGSRHVSRPVTSSTRPGIGRPRVLLRGCSRVVRGRVAGVLACQGISSAAVPTAAPGTMRAPRGVAFDSDQRGHTTSRIRWRLICSARESLASTRPATARRGRPRRGRESHHLPPHPDPRTHQRRRPTRRQRRHGGRPLPIALEA